MVELHGEAAVRIEIQKVNGETVEATARPEDTVREIKYRVSQEANVPPLCQRLLLHEVSRRLIFERTAPLFAQEMEEIMEGLEKSMFQEVKAMARPPPLCHKCMVMILQLISSSPQAILRSASGAMPWKDGNWDNFDWRDCKTMMTDYTEFRNNLRGVVQELQNGNLHPKQVRAARGTLEEIGGLSAPGRLRTVSACCQILCQYTVEVLAFYEVGQQFVRHPDIPYENSLGSVEMRDNMPLSVYVTEKAPACEGDDAASGPVHRLNLSLLVDLEPAFQALSNGVEAQQLEALSVLGELGGGCQERALAAFCECLGGRKNQRIAEAALAGLKKVVTLDQEITKQFLTTLPKFYMHPAGLQAAIHLAPDSLEVLTGILNGLCTPNAEPCMEAFRELAPGLSPKELADCLLQKYFPHRHEGFLALEEEALQLVNVRAHEQLIEGLVPYFTSPQPSWVTRMASYCVTLLGRGDDDNLVAGMTTALEQTHGSALLDVAKSLLGISPGSRTLVLEAFCRELHEVSEEQEYLHEASRPAMRKKILDEIQQLASSDDRTVLIHMVAYVLQSEGRLFSEEDWSMMDALAILKKHDSGSRDFLRKSYRHVERLLAKCCTMASDEAGRRLCALAKEHGGVEHEVMVEISKGFRSQSAKIRRTCSRFFAAVEKREPRLAVKLLIQLISGEEFSWTKKAAISSLDHHTYQEQVEDILSALLLASEANDLALRRAALVSLVPFAQEDRVHSAALRHLGDDDVQLESLKLLAEAPPVPLDCLARCFQSSNSDVVLLALQAFKSNSGESASSAQGGKEISACLAPLLGHRCEEVAQGAAQALGRLTGEGQRLAVAVLTSQEEIWPEVRPAVLEARRAAIHALGAASA